MGKLILGIGTLYIFGISTFLSTKWLFHNFWSKVPIPTSSWSMASSSSASSIARLWKCFHRPRRLEMVDRRHHQSSTVFKSRLKILMHSLKVCLSNSSRDTFPLILLLKTASVCIVYYSIVLFKYYFYTFRVECLTWPIRGIKTRPVAYSPFILSFLNQRTGNSGQTGMLFLCKIHCFPISQQTEGWSVSEGIWLNEYCSLYVGASAGIRFDVYFKWCSLLLTICV